MNWNSVLLLLAFLLVFHVICPPPYMFDHAPPAPNGSVLTGAFGGPAKDDVAVWRVATSGKEATTEEVTTEEPTTEEPITEEPTTAEPTTEEPTTEKVTTEEPSTEEPTTEEPSTVEPTTEAPSTEEPTTEEITTEEPTTVNPTTEEQTTEEPTTEEPTTEAPLTEEPTTEEITTEEATTVVPTTEEPTTEEQSTEEPTTEEATTEEPTTEEITTEALTTEEVTTEDATKKEQTTEESTTEVSATTDDPVWIRRSANGRMFLEKLPNGTLIKDLGKEYGVYNGTTDWSRIVANENGLYVLHPVQSKVETAIFDPYTIGQVLGYIYEKQEFGDKKPPGGKYTIELMRKQIPRKRSVFSGKSRRATLVFTKKNDHF